MWAGMAAAATITSISGTWQDPTPDGVHNLNIDNAVDGSETQISWGIPTESGEQSSFTAEWSGPQEIEIVPGETSTFEVGVFTHDNNIIKFTDWDLRAISSVELNVTMELLIDSEEYSFNQTFTFLFDETLNYPDGECTYGGFADDALNPDGCRDRVVFVENENVSEVLIVNGMAYSIEITGFMVEDDLVSFFLTEENKANQAKIVGRLVVEDIPQTPLPAAGWLLIAGFGALAAVSRKRRSA